MSLIVEKLTRTHQGRTAPTLNNLSLHLTTGTLAAILGPSGAGKSTLLRCIMGLESFETGHLEVAGVSVRGAQEVEAQMRKHQLENAREKLGLVFQSFELFPHLSVLQNCLLPLLKVKKMSRAEAVSKAEPLLSRLGLSTKYDVFPASLSGGQKQRVALARALGMEPQVLLYDEPTSALDAATKMEVLELMKQVDALGVTQMVVTHDLQLARSMEHVCILSAGEVVEVGPPAKVLTTPTSAAAQSLLAGESR
jgi:ABC-type polar amino acid transport system ATPase subunit